MKWGREGGLRIGIFDARGPGKRRKWGVTKGRGGGKVGVL